MKAFVKSVLHPPTVRDVFLGILFIFVGAVLVYAYDVLMAAAPVTYTSISDIGTATVRGGRIEVLFKDVRVRRVCLTQTSRMLWRDERDPDGVTRKHFVPLESQVGPIGLVYPGDVVLSLNIPGNIDPGEWHFLQLRKEECPWLPFDTVKLRASPDLVINVTNPGPAAKPSVVIGAAPVMIVPEGKK